MPSSSPVDKPKCRIAEILQYTCEQKDDSGSFQCFPIPRIFMLCPEQPAIEITKLVDIDMLTGEVNLPANLSQKSVQGRPWKEIVCFASS
ncbi:hypothetical protein BYT27DRAFT_7194337 [Phlegmacium glaucopus]|nr:hypothetical protein BYT27DRAFT_7194337 [Phlegmacium glaucopus]